MNGQDGIDIVSNDGSSRDVCEGIAFIVCGGFLPRNRLSRPN
jgi:hypothetical protein